MRLLAFAIALLAVPQDEKVTFKFNPKQGDKLTQTRKIEFNLDMEVTADDQVHEMKVEQRQSEKLTTEYKTVEDGKVTRKVVEFTESFEERKQPPNNEWQRTDKALHGRKVTIFQKDGQTQYEGADGLQEKELRKVQLTAPVSFPKEALAIGESWELKDEEVRKFLESDQKFKKASMKAKLVEIKEIDKRRCAVLKATVELNSEVEGGMEVSATIEGDIVVWIERGHLLDFKGKGKMTVKGDNEQMSMSGKGDVTLDFSTKVE